MTHFISLPFIHLLQTFISSTPFMASIFFLCFQVIPGENLESTFQELKEKSFPSFTGPLWRVRITSGAEINPTNFDVKKIPSGFIFEHKVLISLHHSITDGFSSLRICGHFINLLDDVLEGREIDDSVQVAEFSDGDKNSQEVMTTIMKKFQEHPEERENALQEYDDFQKMKVLLLDAYPVADRQVTHQTLYLRNDFDQETTKKFLAKCKANNVSFHTGFFTAVQVAVVELLKDAGIFQDTFEISSKHVVNSRRFWNKEVDADVQFGANIAALPVNFTVPSDWQKIFWTTITKEHHLLFMTRLNDFKAQMNMICRYERMMPFMSFEISPSQYYDTNNMGDVTAVLSGAVAKSNRERDATVHVVISDIVRSTSTHDRGVICSHVTQTLRGRLLHSMDYNIQYMDTEIANKYVQKVSEVVKLVADL